MGIKTVAIYSDADANSLHVRMADEAVRVGPPPSSKSYLSIPNIVGAISQTGAQAVHPGYGFLSENSHFVDSLDGIGCTFIGPNAKAIAAMGDKIQSKIIALDAKVNTIPGHNGVVRDTEHVVEIARSIRYPVMIKASAGGGGKGMRIAWNDREARDAFKISSSEALSSFGDDRLLVEKFVEEPRHIEIQLIGDKHGNVIYLPERECSIQRRNQKVIEEAPSTHIDQHTRKLMGEQAVALAKKVGYYSAGTCEFLVDPKRNFYFLEMNTRLQVEHPVTEYITGLDLVEQMIRVAASQHLSFEQSDVKINGWAFESRVYAEDPETYMPTIGTLDKYIEPKGSQDEIRCDSGIVEGSEITVHYDPLICKLCTHGETRDNAIATMQHALDTYMIKGVTHNIPLLRDVFSHPRFIAGSLSTSFLAEEYSDHKGHKLTTETREELVAIASVVHALRDTRKRHWIQGGGSLAEHIIDCTAWTFHVAVAQKEASKVAIKRTAPHTYQVTVDDAVSVDVGNMDWALESPIIRASVQSSKGGSRNVTMQYISRDVLGYTIQHRGTKFPITVKTPLQHQLSKHMQITSHSAHDTTCTTILSPMPGTVVSISVTAGQTVAQGAELVVVEAMKMQNVLRAPCDGVIRAVHVQPGDSVGGDEILIEFEDEVALEEKTASKEQH
ncbi:hypothetical protein PhCBS80983_g01531 [Powellomyces hirtus]|uniref:Propionyl-CoA carboxylase alpha chain, mitochondrial n=1 Tax=Powellomyces hirtus TaxID=109895 RepID=A0A507EAS3_9FUNG|nr:hypothetical protein PhCBS80983_g01531 [Powellomyces hirtus]